MTAKILTSSLLTQQLFVHGPALSYLSVLIGRHSAFIPCADSKNCPKYKQTAHGRSPGNSDRFGEQDGVTLSN